jgi:hypothetical protein
MSPLIEDLLGFGITALPTVAQGDCGLDVMAYWDGVDRTPNQWKTLRLEVGVAIEGLASDPQWHTVFVACAELPSPDTTARARASEPSPAIRRSALRWRHVVTLAHWNLQDLSDMAVAISYFCGGWCIATAIDVGVLTMQLCPAERVDIVQGYRSLKSHELVPKERDLPGPLRQHAQRQYCRLSARRACASLFLEW